MALDDRLSDLLVDWEQSQRDGRETTPEELCKDAPDLLPVVRESIDSLKATRWMFALDPSEPAAGRHADSSRAALHDTELPASHLTVEQFAASIFQSGLLSAAEIAELNQRLAASDLPGEAREIASRLVTEGKLTRYQASVLLKASKDPLLVDNYVILDTLDTGGMGLVFKALHRSMNRVVALKLLPAAMMNARDTVKRFQREVQAAASLSHPNVVAAYDADESAEIAYLVLEYVEGTNLFRLVKERGPLPVAQACNYVRQAATGLAYLHSRGIIHRDVKPANLILAQDGARDGTVKLLDMGLVRFASCEDLSSVETDQELTQAGIVIGTVAYMSPEQALDTRSADHRSDIYSLGCTLFFLLTGRSLYHEETGMKTLLAHREQAVPSIREFCEEAPVSLDAVFRTMVAKRPADRLQSMTEIVAALDACVPGLATNSPAAIARPRHTSSARPIPASLRRGWKRLRSSPLRIALAIALLAGVAAGGTYFAGILIRIKSKHGTTEIRTDDPNATVEVTSDVAALDNQHTVPSTADPLEKQREINQRQAKIQELEAENQRLRAAAAVGRFGRRGFLKEPFAVPRPQTSVTNSGAHPAGSPSVDRLVAEWALSDHPGQTWIWLRENSQKPIRTVQELPQGDFHLEGITIGGFPGMSRQSRVGKVDIDRLASLSELQWLNLPLPPVNDDTVRRLTSLKNLERLSLADTDITDAALTALSAMKRLSSLDISRTAITDAGLEQIAKIKSLNDPRLASESLHAMEWHFDESMPPLPSLMLNDTKTTEARVLKLQQQLPNCAIFASHIFPGPVDRGHARLPLPPKVGSSDREWANWLLDHGALHCHVFTDIDAETAVTRSADLPPIDFHIQKLSFDALPPIRNWNGATGWISDLTPFFFRRLGELRGLRELRIDQRLPSDALRSLTAIKSLQTLRIGKADAGDYSLRALAALTGLATLTFEGSEITDAGVRSLSPLNRLTGLSLVGHARNLHGGGFGALSGIGTLRTLDISGSGLDDEGAHQVGRLTGLERLGLGDTWISGKGLAALAGLTHLKMLNLRHCRRLNSADLATLVELPALEDLTLTDCRINDAAVDTLKKLTKLRTLSLDGTGLSADAIRQLEQALPHTHVDAPATVQIQMAPGAPGQNSERLDNSQTPSPARPPGK